MARETTIYYFLVPGEERMHIHFSFGFFWYVYHVKIRDDLRRFSVRWPKNAPSPAERSRLSAVPPKTHGGTHGEKCEDPEGVQIFFASGWGVEIETSIPGFSGTVA